MALIECPECKKSISDKAEKCIHCGYPLVSIENSGTKNVEDTGHREASILEGVESSDSEVDSSIDGGAELVQDAEDGMVAESPSDVSQGEEEIGAPGESDSSALKEDFVAKANELKKKLSAPVIAVICVGAAVLLGVFAWLFLVCHHTDWRDATCGEPRTCVRCGLTEGEPLEHEWKDATCVEPKKCALCGATSGDALGHQLGEYEVTAEPTCSAEGEEVAKCSVCGESVARKIEKIEHTPGDWEVVKEPVVSGGNIVEEGERVYKCTVCGEQLGAEKFTMSPEELKESFISECQTYTYDQIAREPDSYKGSKATFSGKVLQVIEGGVGGQVVIRLATSGGYDDVLYVTYTMREGQSRILEDDTVTAYGTLGGLHTYKSTLGQSITIPSMSAQYIE